MAAAGLQWDTPLDRGGAAVAASATAARGSNAGGLSRARSGGSVGGGVRLDEDEPQAAASAGMVREGLPFEVEERAHIQALSRFYFL